MRRDYQISALVLMALGGCSSIKSVQLSGMDQHNGLYYYMPKRDFIVTLTVTKGVVDKVAFGVTPSYPDLSKAYVLDFSKNWLGKNTLDITITEQGLLSVANSTTVSGVSDVLKNLASSIGALGAGKAAFNKSETKTEACIDGDYVLNFKPDENPPPDICGVKITIEDLMSQSDGKPAAEKTAPEAETSGLFYRQNHPYRLTVKAIETGIEVQSIQFSPSLSATHFLPVSRTLFANNNAEFVFNDGVPTKYKQDTDGEAIALLKLPADVIGAYFTAVGGVFDAFKARDDKQVASLVASLQLEIERKKYTDCLAAMKISPPDQTTLDQLGCNKQ